MSSRTIVVITAGISQPSSTRLLADRLSSATTARLAGHGITADVTTVELRDIAHDIVNMTLTGFAAGELRDALDQLAAADGVIAVTPLYTTTYSGLFKSFVDVIDPDALRGTPVLLGATGGTPRHSLALDYSIRPLFTYLHADTVTTPVFAATDDWASAGGDLIDRIDKAAGELAAMVAERPQRVVADEFAVTPDFSHMLGALGR